MHKYQRIVCVVVALLASIVAGTGRAALGATEARQEGSATELVEAFHAALAAGDGDRALACMAPEVVIFESGGGEASRDEYASHHLGGDMRFAEASRREIVDQQQAVYGDTAVVLTRSHTTGTIGDREIDANGVETMVLRRTADGWLIVHVHWSSRNNQR